MREGFIDWQPLLETNQLYLILIQSWDSCVICSSRAHAESSQ